MRHSMSASRWSMRSGSGTSGKSRDRPPEVKDNEQMTAIPAQLLKMMKVVASALGEDLRSRPVFGGFHDKVNNHYWRTFGAAALIALIGTGSMHPCRKARRWPRRKRHPMRHGGISRRASAASPSKPSAETAMFSPRSRSGRAKFNVLVDQDIIFPGTYRT